MSAFDTKYTVFVLLARTGDRALYHWDVWRRAAPLLDPIVAAGRGTPTIWATYNQDGYGTYGKVGWNVRGHQMWPVGGPLVSAEASKAPFGSFVMWKPSWRASEQAGVGPDVHLTLWNIVPWGHRVRDFEYGFLLAVSENLPPAARRAAPAAVRGIAGMIDTTLAATTKRPWAVARAAMLNPGPAPKKVKAGQKPDEYARIDFFLTALAHSYWQFKRSDEAPALSHVGKGWKVFR